MRKFLKRVLSVMLAVVLVAGLLPATAFTSQAAGTTSVDKLELKDEYISVTVSGENGGFLIDTLKGNKLDKADDNKYLLYPAAEYDTSYTSFRVTRTDGDTEDYIFGREYGFLGWDSSDVTLERKGNSIVATWSVKDLTITQTLALMDEAASQHGMVAISYSVTSTKDDVANVKVRIMMDTALGYQDYAIYQLPNEVGEFNSYQGEVLLSNDNGQAYDKTFFANNDAMTPTVTAYTLDTMVNGVTMSPYQVAFGHWNNLASTIFDFVPDRTLNFTSQYNAKYMTADSACALYFDIGALEKDKESTIGTYYGIFSNSTVSDEERVSINFPVMPSSMELNDTKDAYFSQVENGRAGDIELQMYIENLTGETVDDVTVVINTQNEITPYADWYSGVLDSNETGTYTEVISEVLPGEELSVKAYFQVKPIEVSEYRRFQVLVYDAGNGETLTEDKLMGSREFQLFCPGELGETVLFNSISPQCIYNVGMRYLFLSGKNFGLLADTTAYTTILRPLAGGDDVVIPSKNVVVDVATGSLKLIVEEEMVAGAYQVIFDWNEVGKEDATASLLQFQVSDDWKYYSPTYGIVTIEYASDTTYQVKAYETEEEYKEKVTDPDNKVLLEFRGDFIGRYDGNGDFVEVTATSVEDVLGKVRGTINISNCLDVEAGNVSIYVENPRTNEQVINVDIDGRVYTTNDRLKVWDGVCALTSIANGKEYRLVQYNYDGSRATEIESTLIDKTLISLIWPSAAGVAQKIAGNVFKLRYCQFGQIATVKTDLVTNATPRTRVISFGAEMSPDFLIPSNVGMFDAQVGFFDKIQMTFARKKYSADQLRQVNEMYITDQLDAMAAQKGTLHLNVEDILFGGGFVGFNTSLEVGIPSYAEGMPRLNGTLNLKIMPVREYWEVGVKGLADAVVLRLEAELVMKSMNGIPCPDKISFFVGGFTPGINIDGMGVFWIRGMGGGINNLYDTIFCVSKVPPISLLLSGQFSLFTALPAKADLELGLRGFNVELSEIALDIWGRRIPLMDKVGLYTYWYPKYSGGAEMNLDILGLIIGSGYVRLEEDTEKDKVFFEGIATAKVNTPSYGIIPSITLMDIELGVNNNAIWGGGKVILVDVGITYYWGGDVDFAFGEFISPTHILPTVQYAIPVYENAETGQILYMSMGSNAVLAAASAPEPIVANTSSVSSGDANDGAKITSSVDRMTHTIDLGGYKAYQDMLLVTTFEADSQAEAERIVKGDQYGNAGVRLVATDDESIEYQLNWLDNSKAANDPANANANAILGYDEEKKVATVAISFTAEESFDHDWKLTANDEASLALYAMQHMASIDSASYTFDEATNQMTASWTGDLLEEVEHLSVYAVNAEDELYVLYETTDHSEISGNMANATNGTATFDIPVDLPSGEYTIKVVGSSQANGINEIADAETKFSYVNPNQPETPVITATKLGGDYSIDVDVTDKQYDGYLVTIYEQQENDGNMEWVPSDFANQWIEAEEDGSMPATITVGGCYKVPYYEDAEGNIVTTDEAIGRTDVIEKEKTYGLTAGKTYRVGVTAYEMDANGNMLLSAESMSSSVTMVAPVKANISASITGAKQLADLAVPSATIDVINQDEVTVNITSDMAVSGTWKLDDTTASGTWSANNTGTIRLAPEGGLTEGEHLLKLVGTNENGDGIQYHYCFRVDATAPRLQLSGPINGSFFDEKVTVTGLSEPGTTITVLVDGTKAAEAVVDDTGSFAFDVNMDTSKLEQTVSIYGTDAAGNQTVQYDMKLMNSFLGEQDASLAIYLDGQDITNQTVPAGKSGLLELRMTAGDKSLVIPANSILGRQAEWTTEVSTGAANIQNMQLSTSSDVNGLVTVTIENQVAAAVLGGNPSAASESYDVTLPVNAIGYAVNYTDPTTVNYGESFSFTVEIAEGYSIIDELKVMANGKELTAVNGVYTIEDIHAPKTVTVEGVADITAPTAEVKVSTNKWNNFLHTITFGLFFKETQTVEITTVDNGSGAGDVYYYIADTAMTLEEVEGFADEDWTQYNGTFAIAPNAEAIIYVKAMDNAGNVTLISSDGLVLKNTTPAIIGVENGQVYYGDTTITVEDKYLDTVKVDGEVVTLTNGEYTIVADNAEHIIEAVDKAGNTVSYTISVYKTYVVTFVADGQTIKTETVNHGSGLNAAQFPEIPAKTGYDQTAPVWNPASLTNVMEDKTVVAVYTPNEYTVTLPTNTEGYTVSTEQSTTVVHNQAFCFTVEVEDGYTATDDFRVLVDGVVLNAVNSIYTIANVQSDRVVTVEGVEDITAPTAEVKVSTNRWNSFLNTITFGKFFKETQNVEITAEDAGRGIDKICYYLAESAMTLEEVKTIADADWTEYAGSFNIDPNKQCIIYVKAVDKSDNVTYISSDGLIVKNTAPVISGVESGQTYYGDITFRVTGEYLQTVTVDGSEVTLTNGEYTIVADNAEHTIEAVDKAGNTVSYRITVYKIYTVTFVADGETVRTDTVNHGANLSAELFPEIPAKVGYDQTAPVWNPASLTNVTADTTVEAVYTPNQYVVELPVNTVGYEVVTEQNTTVEWNQSFSFKVTVAEGYTATEEFTVYVNGTEITEAEGVYTISNIQGDVTVAVEGVEDVTAPAAEVKISANKWNSFLNSITFGTFFKETQTVEIAVNDAGSGVDRIYYYVSDEVLTLDEVKNIANPVMAREVTNTANATWTEYTNTFSISPERKCVIYVKAVDKVGNATYISSDGLILENTAPLITGIVNGQTYHSNVTFAVTDDYLSAVRVDGKEVALTNGRYTIVADNKEHTIEAVDKAGNIVIYKISVKIPVSYSAGEQTNTIVQAPKTDDSSNIEFCIILILAVIALNVVVSRRRREEERQKK